MTTIFSIIAIVVITLAARKFIIAVMTIWLRSYEPSHRAMIQKVEQIAANQRQDYQRIHGKPYVSDQQPEWRS
jgi:hypothetical protein